MPRPSLTSLTPILAKAIAELKSRMCSRKNTARGELPKKSCWSRNGGSGRTGKAASCPFRQQEFVSSSAWNLRAPRSAHTGTSLFRRKMYCSQARVHLRPTRPNHNELHAPEGLSRAGPVAWCSVRETKKAKVQTAL